MNAQDLLPPQDVPAYQEAICRLQTAGVRLTETRKAILAYLVASCSHPSADMIFQDLQPHYNTISLATVYNNLKLLINEGLISEIRRKNDTTTYYDFMGHKHVHLICETCDHIIDLDIKTPDLKKEIIDSSGFMPHRENYIVYGICPECQ